MLPLESKTMPMETGASSFAKFVTGCSTPSSKTRKFSCRRSVTDVPSGVVTWTGIRISGTPCSRRKGAIDERDHQAGPRIQHVGKWNVYLPRYLPSGLRSQSNANGIQDLRPERHHGRHAGEGGPSHNQ